MTLKTAHLIIGTIGLLLFVLQGQYMANVLEVSELADGTRLMYRSSHLYLMLASAINIVVGCYMPTDLALGIFHRITSSLLLIAPVLLLVSFISESTAASFERPITVIALYLVFGAAVTLLNLEILRRWQER